MESGLHIYSMETDAFLDVFVLCMLRAIKNLIFGNILSESWCILGPFTGR